MITRILSALTVVVAAALLVVVAWPQLAGLQNTWVFAHVVSLRALAALVALAAIVVLLLLSLIRPLRRLLRTLSVLLLVFAVANVGILLSRGIGTIPVEADALAVAATAKTEATATALETEVPAAPGDAEEDVTVLSWNTLGDATGADAIAELAITHHADVVTLPETTEATGVAVAELMRAAGQPMWVHTIAFDQISKARSTTLLVSPDLGEYTVTSEPGSGAPGNTSVLPTVVATPTAGDGPTIIAVHAVAPIQWEMSNWRSDLNWLATQCAEGNVIMAGDFNATVDHMAGLETSAPAVLGACSDAGIDAGSGGIGTWPTSAPALLGSPIDHILATANWRVIGMDVIGTLDAAGSDHRPIVARLAPNDGE